jgi:hypothetical protein
MQPRAAFPWAIALSLWGLASNVAHAQPRPYRGPHPVDLEGHWHDESSVHVHDTMAVGLEPFVSVDGVMVFMADPGAYGYAGQLWTFRDGHPLPAGMGTGYCAIGGAHRHYFAPEGEGSFRRTSDGAYVFTGTMRGGVASYVPERLVPPADAPVTLTAQTPSGTTPYCPMIGRVVNGLTVYEPNLHPGFACVRNPHVAATYGYPYGWHGPVPPRPPLAEPTPPAVAERPPVRPARPARAGRLAVPQRRASP